MSRSKLEGFKLTAHVIDLTDEVGPSLFGGGERLMEVGRLRIVSWAGRVMVFGVSIMLKIFESRYD